MKFVQIVHGIKLVLNIFDVLLCWFFHCCFPYQDKIDYKIQTRAELFESRLTLTQS